MLDPRIDPNLAQDVSASEFDSLEAYLDSLGFWTIGRGHLLPPPAPGKSWKGFTISREVDDRYFNEDLVAALAYAQKLPEFGSCDTSCRQNALIELCFNMGGKWTHWGPTRTLMQAKDWQGVHNHLLNSLWASEVQPHHYVNDVCSRCAHAKAPQPPYSYCTGIQRGRADRIANYFLTGQYL